MTVCPYFNICSGCDLQHLDYAQQLQQKKSQIAQLLTVQEIPVFSNHPFHYRNRMEFLFHPKGLGLRKKNNSTEIIDIVQCPIALPEINQLLAEVRLFFSSVDHFNLKTKKGLFRYAVIRATLAGDCSISFVLNEDASNKEEGIKKITEFAKNCTAKNILITFVPADLDEAYSSSYLVVKGNDYLQENLCKKQFHFPIQGFFQNNPALAEKMFNYTKELLQNYNTKEAELLDLCSGVGCFGLVNSNLFKKVMLVESFAKSISYAKKNILLNKCNNISAFSLQSHQLGRITFSDQLFVIADPPRIGLDQKTINQLNTLKPKVILYISCNPSQLAKDLPKFKQYTLKSAALFDLFPQTRHSEVVVELVRK